MIFFANTPFKKAVFLGMQNFLLIPAYLKYVYAGSKRNVIHSQKS